eukprot:TRINITY_DN7467_c4_g1_i1.p1 TRINITY_DN7467_c4_g1~~TRINITY_DN7467_c4_g1_i1.p1  ORF type:complete len:125 (+),score=20.90 TRINITY_DN7467_c4_g1_i1:87-461(+)
MTRQANGDHGDDVLAKQGHTPSGLKAFWKTLAHLFVKLRYLGLAGYFLEWILEATHSSKRLHHLLHRINTPKVHLLAITMVLAGHLAEHLHQEEENHHQEDRLAKLEAAVGSKAHSSSKAGKEH